MSWLAAAGPILSGIGAIAGGLGLGKDKADPEYEARVQQETALRHEKESFNQKMALAQTHGLHPLSVLGVPMATFAPSISSTGGGGVDFTAIGSGMERIAQTQVKPPEKPDEDPLQVRIAEATVRQAEAGAKKAEWDALRAEWTTQDLLRGQPGNPPALRTSNDAAGIQALAAAQAGIKPSIFSNPKIDIKQDILPPHPVNLGHAAGADQSWIRGVDQSGNFYSALNPNLIQADFEDGATITALSKIYGPERAIEIMAVLEQAGPIAGVGAALSAAGAAAYRYFGNQRAEALKRRTTRRSWSRGKGPMRFVTPRNE